jgi:hypothetical protein
MDPWLFFRLSAILKEPRYVLAQFRTSEITED